ncbi:MAG: D-lyxose/D-mannose family sugar isomerase [Verrucomicrobiota bacterium JB024]|nr:D-lyxose/D-mannose family sugar isomerase [Verrucomicrobiota bacterium JB024]
MKRSEINRAYRDALACFTAHHWHLPPAPRWDITDCGLDRFDVVGLVLVNLAEEPEYCEKLMFARQNQVTPLHTHRVKKEDIICRQGRLSIELWTGHPERSAPGAPGSVSRNGKPSAYRNGEPLILEAGERVTLTPGVYHSFWPVDGPCIIGEVSTANDDLNDNFFVDPDIGRFPEIEEDEPAQIRLLREQ